MTPHTGQTNKQRMLAGELYQANDPEIVADHARARDLLERYNATPHAAAPQRRSVLEQLMRSIGDGTEIRAPFWCDFGFNITIGARCFVNFNAVILDCATVTIGDDVQIATNVQLLTATHPLDAATRRAGWESAMPISIGDGAWLGGGVIVCPGVAIGPNTVVGAGSVVIRDLPPGVLAVGNPARVVRTLD